MKNPLTRSLKIELIVLFVTVSILSIVIVAVSSFMTTEKGLTERITQQLESEAKHRTQIMKHVWNLRVDEIKILGSNQVLKNILSESNKKENGENIDKSALEKMTDTFIKQTWPEFASSTETDRFYKIILIDKFGKVVSSTDKSIKTDFSDDPDFLRGLKESFYSLEMDEQNKRAMLFMIVPVINSGINGDEPIGVIMVSRDMIFANKITTDRTNLGESGETYVVNKNKVMFTDSRFVKNGAFEQRVDTLAVRECFENEKEITAVYPDYRGIPVFGASQCERDLGFVLLAEMDVSEAFAPITELQKQYLIIGSITAILIAILSFYMSRSISRPILKLTEATDKIANGNLNIEIEDPKSKNEISKLFHSFKVMMFKMQNHIEEIESLSKKLKSANEELKRNDKLKDEFISIASHELKTPIQPILGFAYLAKTGQISQEEAWHGVIQHSRRLKKLAKDILDVSRIESGTLAFTVGKIRINDIISNVVNTAKVSKSEDVTIDVKLDSQNMEIDASDDRIVQVLSNILDNAMKFTKKGTIWIENQFFSHENKVVIKISDSGIGIDLDILPNLFGKFVSRNTQDGFDRDTGLGLFISKAIVTAHGGKISGHNNEYGGATFTITLPLDGKHEIN